MTRQLLPSAGELIALFIDALGGARDLPRPMVSMLTDRTSRRVFKGGSSRRWCCRLTALQAILWGRDLVALPAEVLAPEGQDGKAWPARVVWLSAFSELVLWDALDRATNRRAAYLRYFAADAYMRIFALLTEGARTSPLLDPNPAWADGARRGEVLRHLLERVTPRRTNVLQAKELGYTPSVLSSWKTGKARPPVAAIGWLAKYIGQADPQRVEAVGKLLHWHYTLSAIAQAIAEAEGVGFTTNLATVWTRMLACSAGRTDLPPLRAETKLVILGTPLWKQAEPIREALLAHVRAHGGDEWLRDVHAVCAEFSALRDTDDLIRRRMPRHPHDFWRMPREARRRSGKATSIAGPSRQGSVKRRG